MCLILILLAVYLLYKMFWMLFCLFLEGLLTETLCTVCGATSHRKTFLLTWPGFVWKPACQMRERNSCRRPRHPTGSGSTLTGPGIITSFVRSRLAGNLGSAWWRSSSGEVSSSGTSLTSLNWSRCHHCDRSQHWRLPKDFPQDLWKATEEQWGLECWEDAVPLLLQGDLGLPSPSVPRSCGWLDGKFIYFNNFALMICCNSLTRMH